MGKHVIYHNVHGTHSTAPDKVATLNSGTLERNQKGYASQLENSRKPFPVLLITENVADLRPIIFFFLFTDRYFIGFNLRKPLPLLHCSSCCSLLSASFPVHHHCAGTPAFPRACKNAFLLSRPWAQTLVLLSLLGWIRRSEPFLTFYLNL